jgi:hypothetical protein
MKLLILIGCLLGTLAHAQSGYWLSGQVRDSLTHALLPGVTVKLASTRLGTTTDQNGTFRLQITRQGAQTVRFSSVGYQPTERLLTGCVFDCMIRYGCLQMTKQRERPLV